MSHNNVFLNSKYASGFSPQNIPGLVAWLDAADSTAVTQSSGVVSAWRGKSPLTLDMVQNTSGARPTYESNVQNGLPALRFTTSQMMQSTSNLALPPDQTWFVSFRPLAGTSMIFLEHGPNVNSTAGSMLTGLNSDLFAQYRGTTLRAAFDSIGRGTSPFSVGTWYIASFVNSNLSMIASNDLFWSVNGSARNMTFGVNVSNVLSGNATDLLYINPTSRAPGSNYTGEILVYNRALPPSEVRLVERYLSHKWGVTLPTAHPYFSVPAVMRPFIPLDVSGCQFWIDAADARTVTLSGNTVTGVADKSGNGRNLSNGNIFTYNQTLFNGKYPSFYNSSTSGLLGLNSSVSLAQPLTIFAMAQSETPNNTFAHIADSLNSGSRVVLYFWNSNSSFRTRLFAGGEIEDLSGPMTFVNSYVANTTASQIYINGALRTSGDIGSGALSGLIIANRFTTTEQSWRGHLCEVLIYSSVLSSNDRQQVELYLAEKWGLRSSLSTSNALRLFRALSPVFNPTMISGCSLWLDAADRSTLTLSGSNITQWRDKSPNAFTVSNNGSNPPGTVLGAQFNNLPVVSFPSNSQMNVTMAIPNSNSRSLFYVARASSAGSSFVMPLGSLSTNGNESYFIPNATSTNFNALDRQGVITTCSFTYTGGSTQDTVFMLGAVAGTAGTINGNIQSITTSAPNFATASITYTISRSLYTRTWELGEMILFNVNLDTAQRQQVEAYLAWKWGLVGNLPTAHPYKSIKP